MAMRTHSGHVTRRSALRAMGASAGAVTILPWLSDEGLLAFTRLQQEAPGSALRVLSRAQFLTLETLSEAIIPADERSPGAKEARVAEYIDLLLSELPEDGKQEWLAGVEALDAEAQRRFGAAFAALPPDQTTLLLTEISRNERAPLTPLETFFKNAKSATIRGYYSSEIGIHKELRYKGNTIVPQFVGCSTEDGKDCPHCGQKAADERLPRDERERSAGPSRGRTPGAYRVTNG
jgi:hypothetical protein